MSRKLFWSVLILLTVVASAASAEESDEVRLRAAVVLDDSMSMNRQDPGELAIVAARLLVDLATPRDEITLISFGTKARILGRETMSTKAARETLYQALGTAERTEWCTDYRVGLREALDLLGDEARPGERRLIIFLTDGLFDPDRSNESYYGDDEGREQLEKARRQKAFAERPCARSYKRLIPHVEPGFLAQMDELVGDLSSSGIRLYTVGLGSDIASDSAEAARSRALLERLASSTGGAFLSATSGDQLPRFFASIYSALVGAPVEAPRRVSADVDTIEFDVLRGAERVAVIVDAAGDRELQLAATAPNGSEAQAMVRPFNVDTREADGYRVLTFATPEPGRYRLHRRVGAAALKIQVIQEVGLRLAVEGLPEVAAEGAHPEVTVALRSSAGEPVTLAPEFRSQIMGTFDFGPAKTKAQPPTSFRFDDTCEKRFAIPPLEPGRYHCHVEASHQLGLLHVEPVDSNLEVLHQIEIELDTAEIEFDEMAEEGLDLVGGAKITLSEGSTLPIDQELTLDWTKVSDLEHVRFGPKKVILGPEKRSAPITFELEAPRKLRSSSLNITGEVRATPANPELFRGDPSWNVLRVEGRIRPWDWYRYYQEYWAYFWGTLAATFLLFWLIGRLVAAKWPKRAKLHYIDLEDPTRMETSIRLRKHSRSHLPFRSDRHRVGRGGKPGKRSKRKYCDLIASGRGFRVLPRDAKVTYEKYGEDVTTKDRFEGRWEHHYRLDERYEIWLTRT